MASESELGQLLGLLALLPANVNRFAIAAAAVQAKIAYRLDPRARPLMFLFSVLLGIAFLLAIVGMFFRLRSGTFRFFTINSGLIMPQATVMFAFWMAIFCVGEIGSIIGLQTWSDQKKPLPPILVFLMGTIWITVYLAVGPWLWSIAAASIRTKIQSGNSRASDLLPELREASEERSYYRRTAILLNCYAISAHVIAIPPQIVIFYYAARSWSQALSIFLDVIAKLHAASLSYNPSTFSINADLIPLLIPLAEAEVHFDHFLHLYAIGFGMWVGYNVLFLLAWLTPFFYSHMKQLVMLSKRSPSLVFSMFEATAPASISRDTSKNVTKPVTKRGGLNRRQADYRMLLMASAVVYAVGVVITAVSLAVAVNPDFVVDPVKGAIFIYLAAGMFALLTPFVMVVCTWRSYVAYRESQRLKHPSPEAPNRCVRSNQHSSSSPPHQVHFDRFEETQVDSESGIVCYPFTPWEVKEGSPSPLDKEKDALESQTEPKLGEVAATAVEKESVSARLTIGWNEAVLEAGQEGR